MTLRSRGLRPLLVAQALSALRTPREHPAEEVAVST